MRNLSAGRHDYILGLKIFLFFLFCFLYFHIDSALATSMSNNNYMLQINQINNLYEQTIAPLKPAIPNVSEEKPYTITTFGSTFGFSVSNIFIDFGFLSPTNPITRTSDLEINSNDSIRYNVIGFENHPLRSEENSFIPDTTCDDGYCKQDASSPWANILTYGFGFRCDNILKNICGKDFINQNYFKQFSDSSHNEYPQTILEGIYPNAKSEITYKINVSNTFKRISFSNVITYIAIPLF